MVLFRRNKPNIKFIIPLNNPLKKLLGRAETNVSALFYFKIKFLKILSFKNNTILLFLSKKLTQYNHLKTSILD
ncbi:hypothetical protein TASCI_100037 [Tenacibaculum ascidiaceicola]